MNQHPLSRSFPLGQTVITPNALEKLHPEDVNIALRRHAAKDWGEVCPDDWTENELSLKEGFRVLSAYRDRNQVKFWIITESDRSATTVLLLALLALQALRLQVFDPVVPPAVRNGIPRVAGFGLTLEDRATGKTLMGAAVPGKVSAGGTAIIIAVLFWLAHRRWKPMQQQHSLRFPAGPSRNSAATGWPPCLSSGSSSRWIA